MRSIPQTIRAALRSYTFLTNNARIKLLVDGQKFYVIVRLLAPGEKTRMSPNMTVLVSKKIYVRVVSFLHPEKRLCSGGQ